MFSIYKSDPQNSIFQGPRKTIELLTYPTPRRTTARGEYDRRDSFASGYAFHFIAVR
jgi:hypothetical protein